MLPGTTIRTGAQPLAAVGIMKPIGRVAVLCSVHVRVSGRTSRRAAGIGQSQIWQLRVMVCLLLLGCSAQNVAGDKSCVK